jgi:hypothetical protein
MTRSLALFLGAALAVTPEARAEQKKLAFLIPGLFGEHGLVVGSEAPLPNGQTHSAHFNNAFQSEFTQFNVALASQLATLPVPAPATAFTYKFDETLGVFSRSTDSFGPILSERAETAGKGKFNFGFAYQRFTFDSLEDASLDSIPAVFTHDLPAPGGRSDVVSTVNSIETSLDQFVAFANFGLASRLDVSVAVPLVTTEIRASSVATVQRIGTVDPKIHFLGAGGGDYGTTRTFTENGSASGIGDVLVRFKAKAFEWGSNGLAFALETRLPTGDEEDFLGSGAFGLKPAIIFSSSHKVVSFHLNGAYQWNGDSLLAGNVQTGEKADMPDQILYSGGLAVAASKRLTLVADLLGRHFIDTPRLQTTTFTALDGRTTLPDITFKEESFDELFVATGLRLNVAGGLLLDLNVLFSLTETGLRDKITPLASLAYSF